MSRFFKEFSQSTLSYYQAFQFVRKHKLKGFILGAAFFNLFAFLFVGVVAWIYTGTLIDFIYSFFSFPEDWEEWGNLIQILTAIFIRIVLISLYINLFKYVILIIFAPVLAVLSERTQNILNQQKKSINLIRLISEIGRGMLMGSILIGLNVLLYLFLIFLSLVFPFLSPALAVVVFLLESFFFGASMLDYRNEYYQLSIKTSLQKIFKHKGLVLGNGLALNLFILIPFIGVLFAPSFALIASGIHANKVIS
ncbi:EI24 domain-containing protein [Marivirga harenae]|uniref:EI24 domain-containing protein n=1 Tax=Marivirga harenae TaxID=2010992 RepID=UPI0026DF3229|nr:EI24 domain-containing protein [Marivirga harenae]WKV11283.1 EI24 domain-containing protein [Marivirga harenae]|tara:strand:- start:15378 stop:16133 length:756 start_codon:yes stop_codon:yes gene_type:complete